MNVISFFKYLFSKPLQEKHMKHFSVEYRDKLVAEHRLISATLLRIAGSDHARMCQQHSQSSVLGAISNLKSRRVELVGLIDVMNEYLI